jgi:hypothetical protein
MIPDSSGIWASSARRGARREAERRAELAQAIDQADVEMTEAYDLVAGFQVCKASVASPGPLAQ